MKKKWLSFLALTALTIWVQLGLAADQAVSFSKEIVPIFRSNCANCHMTGEEMPGGLLLHPSAAYKSIVNVQSRESKLMRVSPGSPQNSYLIHKLEGTHLDAGGAGVQMPFGLEPLVLDLRVKIRRWIEQGAKNN